MKALAKQQKQMLTVLHMQLAQNASTPYERLDQNPFHMFNTENDDDSSSDDESDSSSSSSSDNEATTVDITSDSIATAVKNTTDNNNSNVNAYHASILRSQPDFIIKEAIAKCKRKASSKVTFSTAPPEYIPYPFLTTKHVTTGTHFQSCRVQCSHA